MISVYFCTVYQHELWLVAVAALVCGATATAGLLLYRRAARRNDLRRGLAAGATIGLGVWVTHFVAMLGYVPGVDLAYQLMPTLVSLGIAIASVALAVTLALHLRNRAGDALAGAIAGGGIAAMHYLGTSALAAPVAMTFDAGLVRASLVLAIVPLAGAFHLARQARGIAWSCLLLVLAVCGLHFTGMAAIRLMPSAAGVAATGVISGHALSLLVGLAGCLVLATCLVAVRTERQVRAAVHRSERDFSILVKGISDCALYMLTPEGRVASWNAGAERLKGYSRDEVVGLPLATFYTERDRADGAPERALAQAAESGKFTGEGWRMRKDGTTFWAHVTIERIHDSQGRPVGFAKITRDMTRWKEAQDRLAATTAQLDTALDNMHQGLALFDPEARLMLCNRRLLELWQLAPGRAQTGTALPALLAAMLDAQQVASRADARTALEAAMRETPEGPVTIACHPGFIVAVASRRLPDGGWVSTFEDVTERHLSEARIAHMAMHDTLTGLANRVQFNEWCQRELDHVGHHDQRFAMVAIDLDRFKEINDHWGHAEGDLTIQTVAARLQAVCREGEMVARLGGDEFAAAMAFDDDAALSDFVARLAGCFAAPTGTETCPVPVAASFGVAVHPTDGRDREALLNNADLAMYRAKASLGEHICYYQPNMDEVARTRRQIAAELRNAADRGELLLLYQPQHVVQTGELIGYEALLRWQHPVRGMVNPLDFIGIAEETGEIFAIGEWVLREAAREAAAWDERLKVAVNLSPVQLLQDDLVPKIVHILMETGLPARRLELEITESAIIADKARALHMLRQIKALGISIAMDDFGTGYSSLDTLHSFPFDKIKIDKSFLQQSSESAQAAAIVRAVLALGRSLGIPVLAEGVEDRAQVALLSQEGCQEAQGFLYGRPQRLARVAEERRATG